MNPAVFALFSLAVTSAMLSLILAIAWIGFGRPRHAALWSAAFGLGTVEWTINLLSITVWTGNILARPATLLLSLAVMALIVQGFRARQSLPLNPRLWAAGLLPFSIVVVSAAILARGGMLDRSAPFLFFSLGHILSATTLVGRGTQSNPAERAAFVVLNLAALFYGSVGVLALADGGVVSASERAAYGALLLFGVPTAYTATGLFSVFLLAADLSETMRRLAILDPLTGVLNRRGLEQAARPLLANARRFGQPVSVVVADLDRFKAVNDGHGHAAGDRVLTQFATHVGQSIRGGDLFARLGGEEFALILVNTPERAACEVVDRIRERVAAMDTGVAGLTLTCSFGITGMREEDDALHDMLVRADGALYGAKQDGRNRVILAAGADRPVAEPCDDPPAAPPARLLQRAPHR